MSNSQFNLNTLKGRMAEQLQKWETECCDYNEMLKELANQQISFDLDDGVNVNYEKFKGIVADIK